MGMTFTNLPNSLLEEQNPQLNRRRNIIERFLDKAAKRSGKERVLLTIFLVIPFGFILMAFYLIYLYVKKQMKIYRDDETSKAL